MGCHGLGLGINGPKSRENNKWDKVLSKTATRTAGFGLRNGNTTPSSPSGPCNISLNLLRYQSTCSLDGAEVGPIPYWSGIINGLGKHDDVRFINSRLSAFYVQRGKTYRFRLIGAQANYAYKFYIQDHKLRVIATDGFFIKAIEADYLIVNSGERYDFLLEANQARGSFLIRAETLEVNCNSFRKDGKLDNNDAIAALSYRKSVDMSQIELAYMNDFSKPNCIRQNPCTVVNCPFKDWPEQGYTCVNVDEFELLVPTPESELPVFSTENPANESTFFFNFGFDSAEFTSTVNGRNFLIPPISLQTDPDAKDELKLCKNVDSEACSESESECQCTQILDIGEEFYKKPIRWELVHCALYQCSLVLFNSIVEVHRLSLALSRFVFSPITYFKAFNNTRSTITQCPYLLMLNKN